MKRKPTNFIRYALQLISLAFFIFLFIYLIYPLDWQTSVLQWFSRLDPWALFSQLRWQLVIPTWVWLPILTIIVTLVLGRVFCGWFCPFGAFMMLVDKISRVLFKNKCFKKIAEFRIGAVRKLLPIRYFWLFFLFVVFIFGSNFAYTLTPFALFSQEIVQILRGAVPWVLIAIMIITIFFSRLWCSIFCPTGILLSLIGKQRLFRYRTAGGCTHCKKCAQSCSVGAAPDAADITGEGCLVCGECQAVCPKATISFQKKHPRSADRALKSDSNAETNSEAKRSFTRRQFIKIAIVFIIGIAVSLWGKAVRISKKILRPPGALEETRFRAVCNRCGRCIKVCPNNALQPMPLTEGIDAFETPQIIPRQANCNLCLVCQEVCPTGAIAKVPVEQVKMGTSAIDKPRCLAWGQGKDCFVCGETCPIVAIDIDDQKRPIVTDRCVGCGTCELNCPVEGVAAIRVTAK